MNSPRRSLSGRDLEVYFRFTNCQLRMSPEDFRAKHGASNLQIARICKVAEPTADRWFFEGASRTSPKPGQLFLLGLMDWLLENSTQLPAGFWEDLCASLTEQGDRSDPP